ncbi:hypothetical protein HDU98_004692, partial [Podochytrium sp. JEL0797]
GGVEDVVVQQWEEEKEYVEVVSGVVESGEVVVVVGREESNNGQDDGMYSDSFEENESVAGSAATNATPAAAAVTDSRRSSLILEPPPLLEDRRNSSHSSINAPSPFSKQSCFETRQSHGSLASSSTTTSPTKRRLLGESTVHNQMRKESSTDARVSSTSSRQQTVSSRDFGTDPVVEVVNAPPPVVSGESRYDHHHHHRTASSVSSSCVDLEDDDEEIEYYDSEPDTGTEKGYRKDGGHAGGGGDGEGRTMYTRESLRGLSPRSISRKLENELKHQEVIDMASDQIAELQKTHLFTLHQQDQFGLTHLLRESKHEQHVKDLELARQERELAQLRVRNLPTRAVPPMFEAAPPVFAPAAGPFVAPGASPAKLDSYSSYETFESVTNTSLLFLDGASLDALLDREKVRVPQTREEYMAALDARLRFAQEYAKRELKVERERVAVGGGGEEEKRERFGILTKFAVEKADIERARMQYEDSLIQSEKGTSPRAKSLQPATKTKPLQTRSGASSIPEDFSRDDKSTGASYASVSEALDFAQHPHQQQDTSVGSDSISIHLEGDDAQEAGVRPRSVTPTQRLSNRLSSVSSYGGSSSGGHTATPTQASMRKGELSVSSYGGGDPASSAVEVVSAPHSVTSSSRKSTVTCMIAKLQQVSTYVSQLGHLSTQKARLEKAKAVGERMVLEAEETARVAKEVRGLEEEVAGIVGRLE